MTIHPKTSVKQPDFASIVGQFALQGDFVAAVPYGNGHINDTYAATLAQAGTRIRYILQRVNHAIFADVPGLMGNIVRVTEHQRAVLRQAGANDVSRRALTVVPSIAGEPFWRDDEGNFWRVYLFIESATGYEAIESAAQAYAAARAFGLFQAQLQGLTGGPLQETIPNFHHTRNRFTALLAAAREDVRGRLAQARAELDFALARETMVDVLIDLAAAGKIPERTTHNDTKLNNVLLDDVTGEGLCVIDLDTVMPGLTLYDFGDMVRTATRPTPEDETELDKVEADLDMFAAVVHGYLETAGGMLTPVEREHLTFSARLITFEIGLRFLTDFLLGDGYFKTRRAGHNLDRCRVQFKMVESFERQERAMRRIVRTAGELSTKDYPSPGRHVTGRVPPRRPASGVRQGA